MIIFKHCKIGDVSWVSHRDILRVLQRGLKRARISVNYSRGFVPHMLTYTTTPVPLGVQSLAEYFAVDCLEKDADDALLRYNDAVPSGMRGVAGYYKDKNPNLAAIVVACDYEARGLRLTKEIEQIRNLQSYVISTMKKGEAVDKDIAPLIYGLSVQGDKLYMRLASGNANLRADSLIKHFNEKYRCDIKVNDVVRTAQLVESNGKLIDAEELLK